MKVEIGGDACTSQGTSKFARNPQKPGEEAGTDPPSQASKGTTTLLTSSSETLDHPNREEIDFFC